MAAPKVLVIDDDPNIQRVLLTTLQQEGYQVHVASDGEEGVEKAAVVDPDLILMDVAMPKLDGYAATALIRAAEQNGVKPFHPLELIARIKAVLSRSGIETTPRAEVGERPPGKLCCFYGAKGGVGTTTVVVNTAIALAQRLKRSTAVVDANLQFGDMRVFLDLGLDTASIVNAITKPDLDADLLRRLMVTHDTGMDVLLAPPNPESADIVAERQRNDPQSLSTVLRLLRHSYDYTLIDMARTLDDFNLQLLDECDMIFLLVTADLSSLKNVRTVLGTMESLQYERSKTQLILNRSTAFTGINVESAENALGRKIDYQIINDYRAAISALNTGAPVLASKADGALGQNITKFARHVDAVLTPAVAPAAS
jgi:pilus assembly protein CpaE